MSTPQESPAPPAGAALSAAVRLGPVHLIVTERLRGPVAAAGIEHEGRDGGLLLSDPWRIPLLAAAGAR